MTTDILRDLQDRVTHLEQQLGDTPGIDNLQPNVLTVNPDGTIGANFTGKVQATELDLVAGTSPSPIKWVNTAGAMVAELTSDQYGNVALQSKAVQLGPSGIGLTDPGSQIAWKSATTGQTDATISNSDNVMAIEVGSSLGIGAISNSPNQDARLIPNGAGQLRILAGTNGGYGQASLEAEGTDGGSAALIVRTSAGARSVGVSIPGLSADPLIIDSTGASSFPQLTSYKKLLIDGPFTSGQFTLGAGAEASFTITLAQAYTTHCELLGGLATNDNNGGSELCTWAYTPTDPNHVRVTVRNNSPYGMSNSGIWQGYAVHD